MSKHVIDDNHGIDELTVDRVIYGHETTGDTRIVYVPWYIRKFSGRYETCYYALNNNWGRVECNTWEAAYNYIARSRRLPTLKHTDHTKIIHKAMEIAKDPSDVECVAEVIRRTNGPDVEINLLEIRAVVGVSKQDVQTTDKPDVRDMDELIGGLFCPGVCTDGQH